MKSNKISVMFLIPSLDVGGAEKQIMYLLNNLNRKRYTLYICLFKGSGMYYPKVNSDVKVFFCSNYKNIMKTTREIRKIIEKENIDIVNSFLPTANLYLFFLRLYLKKKVRLISSQRGIRHNYFNKWTLFEFLAHKSADIVVANSLAVKENITKFLKIDPVKVVVINNGVPLVEIDHEEKRKRRSKIVFENDYPVLLSIGRFDLLKGHQYLIRSVEQLLNKGVNVNLIIVGGGVLRDEIDNLIIKKGLGKFIKLYEKRGSIKEFLLAADCFLLATLSEGASNAIMEAMASSLPVITTDIPSNRELIDDGVNGFLVSPQKPDLFADKIEEVLKDPEGMAKAGKRGERKMKSKFTIERMVGMYENLYEDI